MADILSILLDANAQATTDEKFRVAAEQILWEGRL